MFDDRTRVLRHPIGTWEKEYEELRGAQRHTAAYHEIVRVIIPRGSSKPSQEMAAKSFKNEQDNG